MIVSSPIPSKCLICICFFDVIHFILSSNTSHYKENPLCQTCGCTLLNFCIHTGATAGPLVRRLSLRWPIKEDRGGEEGGTERCEGGEPVKRAPSPSSAERWCVSVQLRAKRKLQRGDSAESQEQQAQRVGQRRARGCVWGFGSGCFKT